MLGVGWMGDGCQYADDGDDHHQFNQRKATVAGRYEVSRVDQSLMIPCSQPPRAFIERNRNKFQRVIQPLLRRVGIFARYCCNSILPLRYDACALYAVPVRLT